MKKALALVTLLTLTLFGCTENNSEKIFDFDDFEGWTARSANTNKTLNDVYFADENYGWIAGDDGLILHTKDGGVTWETQETPTNQMINSIYFIDEENGWAVGGETDNGRPKKPVAMYTSDGGHQWQLKQIENSDAIFYDVLFVDDEYGWIVGNATNGNMLFNTTDGGSTWFKNDTIENPREIISAHFYDRNYGWIAGNEILMNTTDGGANWYSIEATGSYRLSCIQPQGPNGTWFVGWYGLSLSLNENTNEFSSDRGPFTTSDLYRIVFSNESTAWISGERGLLYYSTDAGPDLDPDPEVSSPAPTWIRIDTKTNYNMYGIFFSDEQHGWIVGEKGMIYSTVTGGF